MHARAGETKAVGVNETQEELHEAPPSNLKTQEEEHTHARQSFGGKVNY